MLVAYASQAAQLLGSGLVVEVAHEGVARVGGDGGDATAVQDLGRSLQQALLRVVRVHFDVLRHGMILGSQVGRWYPCQWMRVAVSTFGSKVPRRSAARGSALAPRRWGPDEETYLIRRQFVRCSVGKMVPSIRPPLRHSNTSGSEDSNPTIF